MVSIDQNGYIGNPFQNFIHTSRYARWIDDKNRRETWEETVDRYMNFMYNHLDKKMNYTIPSDLYNEVRQSILQLEVLPSMRCLMSAGPALELNSIAAYNCSFVPIDSPRAFDEILYILMHGTGVGFSVESKSVEKLPPVSDSFEATSTVIIVEDSKEGWQKAFKELIAMLYSGNLPQWDVSRVREKGARLKTFGGRASGPEPLVDLFQFTSELFVKAAGRKLRTLECHDLVCKIAEIVVVGGVRRSALISLSDLEDQSIAKSKSGEWWNANPQRALSNNSAVYLEKPDTETFLREWATLIESKSGERGIFNREASIKAANRSGRRSVDGIALGTNPCSEINLKPNQFCNLSTIVIDGSDTEADLERKVELATILGTWQSTLTNFKGLRSIWKKNTEEERLLGVSMTGIFGNSLLNGKKSGLENRLEKLKQIAIDTNKKFADEIGIPSSTAITCVKPEGTVSQLTLTSSGIHPWYSEYYIRTVRGDKKDPVSKFLMDSEIPYEDDVMHPDSNVVFSFPIKAPKDAITRKDIDTIEHLELWLTYQRYWCEHKPSVTINVKSHEWIKVASWVYDHFDEVTGISFLPYDDHTYRQAPYQEISALDYSEASSLMPTEILWPLLSHYEQDDSSVVGGRELACSAGASSCEIVDIGIQT